MNIFGWIGLGIALVLVLALLASCIQTVSYTHLTLPTTLSV